MLAVVLLLISASAASAASIRGTARADRLSGTNAADTIMGRSGGDQLSGRDGADRVRSGNGRDLVHGGRGDDRIDGDRHSDHLLGNAGRDAIKGGSGADRIFGGGGDDVIDSQDGTVDFVHCGAGSDILVADANDRVSETCERPTTPADTVPAEGRTGGWIVCAETTMVRAEPGLTMFPKPLHMTVDDTITDCMGSDPAITSAHADVFVSSVAGTCAGGPIDGIAYLTWNTGDTTTLVFAGAFGGPVATARGAVIGGTKFVGQHFYAADVLRLEPSMPAACGSAEGLKAFRADGRIMIGLPFVGGPGG